MILSWAPSGYTVVWQPADTAWNYPLKARIRHRWMAYIREQFAAWDKRVKFQLKPPTRANVIEWIADSVDTISNGFCVVINQIGEESDECNDIVAMLESLPRVDHAVGAVEREDDVLAKELFKLGKPTCHCRGLG